MTERFRQSAEPEPSRRQPDVFARLEQAVGQIQDSETFRAYLDMQSRFYRYSPGNVALILSQRPEATRVAGYNSWLHMHRFVRRGEHAIRIIVPMSKKVQNADGEEERRLIFGTGNVFDVAQTDGKPLPQIEVPELTGADGAGLFDGLSRLGSSEGLAVNRVPPEHFSDERMGDYEPTTRAIRVREAAPAQMTKTLAHELAHHFAGHAHSDEESETTAEAVAYVVCGHFGLDTGQRSFPYIATWSKDQKVLQRAMGTIQKVSATIIDKLQPPIAQEDELPPMAGGAPLKVYRGFSEDDGSAMERVAVIVESEDGGISRLTHEQHHSPDGFSWGYSGSGPSELARSLLADHLGYVPPPAIYQAFKRAHVARWEQGKPWAITSEQIDDWLVQSGNQERLAEHLSYLQVEAELQRLNEMESPEAPQDTQSTAIVEAQGRSLEDQLPDEIPVPLTAEELDLLRESVDDYLRAFTEADMIWWEDGDDRPARLMALQEKLGWMIPIEPEKSDS